MHKVALFSTHFLRYSQTFIYEELRNHERYQAEVFTRERLLPERFPWPEVHVAGRLYPYTRASAGFDRLFEARRYSLVHAHFGTGAVYGVRWAQRFSLPLVVSFHGADVAFLVSRYERLLPKNWRYVHYSPQIFETMTLGLCASAELASLLEGIGAPSSKLRVHRLGIDLQAFEKGQRVEEATRVVMIGRFVEKKGFEFGLRAFAKVASTRPTAQLTVVGEGELESKLRALVRQLGIEDRVTFPGVLDPKQIAALLSRSDIMLAPSVVDRHENRDSGLIVAKEASASEVVPIGSRHGGIPDIIDDGGTGYLVGERDIDALAQRLTTLIDDPSLRRRMGQAARAKMLREYDNRACVARLETYYDEALALHSESVT